MTSSRVHIQVLHVRSLSEWAPVCIGPYSQANVYLEALVHLAGQIPLDPALMTVWGDDLRCLFDRACPKFLSKHDFSTWSLLCTQLILSLKHVSSILKTLNSSNQRLVCCVVYVNLGTESPLASLSSHEFFNDLAELGRFILSRGFDQRVVTGSTESTGSDDDDDSDLEPSAVSPLLLDCVAVSGLPRDCLVEVEATACSALLPGDDFIFHSAYTALDDGVLKQEGEGRREGDVTSSSIKLKALNDLSSQRAIWKEWPLLSTHGDMSERPPWGLPADNSHTASIARLRVSTEDEMCKSLRSLVRYKTLPRALVAATADVFSANDTLSITELAPQIAHLICMNIIDILYQAQLASSYIQSIRVYHSCSPIELSLFAEALEHQITLLLYSGPGDEAWTAPFVYAPVPPTSRSLRTLTGEYASKLLSVHLFAIDSAQVETATWIHRGR